MTSRQRVTRSTIAELHEAADNLGRMCGEITCIALLLDHPWRNRKDIAEWRDQVRRLGLTEQNGIVWP